MTSIKYEVEKYTTLNQFQVIAVKDVCSSGSIGILEALEGEFKLDRIMTEKDKTELMEKAHNVIVLSFGDKVLRQVSKQKTATGLG